MLLKMATVILGDTWSVFHQSYNGVLALREHLERDGELRTEPVHVVVGSIIVVSRKFASELPAKVF
jgi:phage-related protein